MGRVRVLARDELTVERWLAEAAETVHKSPADCAEFLDRVQVWAEPRRDLVRLGRAALMRADLAYESADMGAAVAAYRQARRLWLSAGRELEVCLADLGLSRIRIVSGEYARVREDLARLRRQVDDIDVADESLLVQVNAELNVLAGDVAAGTGVVSTALAHYDVADNLSQSVGDVTAVARVQLRRGMTYLDLGMAHRALHELSSAHTAFAEAGWRRWAARTAPFHAEAEALTGRPAAGLRRIEEMRGEVGGDPVLAAFHDLSRAKVLLATGLHGEAMAAARSADEVFSAIDAVELSARATMVVAGALMETGRLEQAETEFIIAERLFASCGATIKRTWTWLGQARVASAVGEPARVRELCERVLGAGLDEVAPGLVVQAQLLQVDAAEPADAVRHLRAAGELAMRTGLPHLRLQVGLGRARVRRRAGDLDAALHQLRGTVDVARRWMQATGQAVDSPAHELMTSINDELIETLLARGDHYSVVEAWQRTRAAKIAAIDSLNGGIRMLADESLPAVPQEPEIEFHVGVDDVVAFVLGDGQVDARRLPGAVATTRRLVTAWQQECLLVAATDPEQAPASSPALESLAAALLDPLGDLLAHLEGPVQVLGHRHLRSVPFDVLVDLHAPWPVEGVEEPPVNRRLPRPRVLVLAAADEHAPEIAAEAQMIRATLPGAKVFTGADATRDELRRWAPAADLVHLAGHGVFRPENPLYSALRLGDGWLAAHEILGEQLGLRGSYVVLSACSSGRADETSADPFGLSWSCLAVGALGVVAALWPVDDAVTAELMRHFYGALADGHHPAEALRIARVEIARTHPHPFYWGAFTLVPALETAAAVDALSAS